MRDIGKNIKHFRVKKNLTQDQLAEELYVTRQTVSNYETGKSRPDVDMLVKISQVLGTDIGQLIYGPEPKQLKPEVLRLIIGGGLTVFVGILWAVLRAVGLELQRERFVTSLSMLVYFFIRPAVFLLLGWLAFQLLSMALQKKPLECQWARRVGMVLLTLLMVCFCLTAWYAGAQMVNEWQFENHIRGEWVETESIVNGKTEIIKGWSMLPPAVPDWLSWFVGHSTYLQVRYPVLHTALTLLIGAVLNLCGFPWKRKTPAS